MSATVSWFFLIILFSALISSIAVSILESNQQIRDGEYLVSSGERFRLGFFSPGNSVNRFIGLWFNNVSVRRVVWVANRGTPLTDRSGILTVTNRGLTVLNGNSTIIWCTGNSESTESSENLVAELLDSGNLIMRERDSMSYMWQSFDHPTYALLAGMKLGWNNVTGLETRLTSWTTDEDLSVGNYTFEVDKQGFPHLVVKRNSVMVYRWNDITQPNPYYKYTFVSDQEKAYYFYEMIDVNVKMMLVINPNGEVQRLMWSNRDKKRNTYLELQRDNCSNYNPCGANAVCNIKNSPQCGCLDKFEPRNISEGNVIELRCVRAKPLDCHKGDEFLNYKNLILQNDSDSWYNRSMNFEECRMLCLRNCSCMAYAGIDIKSRTGCLIWFGDLINIRHQYNESLPEIYIRLASSDVIGSSNPRRNIFLVSLVSLLGILIVRFIFVLYSEKKKKMKNRAIEEMLELGENSDDEQRNVTTNNKNVDSDLPIFDYLTIVNATNNFSTSNKIGEGGFGPVYKGVLEDGQLIAVKKLSTSSRQGVVEFKNEVSCIAKLQHRNLVKLLGCCTHVEKILVYEYMPNNSLDYYIFDEQKNALLDWPKLYNIIIGISRGLLYLHQDSRLRIIHRDLKASNVLLDHEMNPKISDFGMARCFSGNETEANTTRVVGTYGYMSPEYVVDGIFSTKSDVFSFGVLVLEIVSGKKNRGFSSKEHYLNLLGHAWRLHDEGRSLELVNEHFLDSCNFFEILRSIHIGLLCVQQFPDDRPSMSIVVLMLSSDGELPQPKKPGFYTERSDKYEINSSLYDSASINEITTTLPLPR